MNLSIRWKLLGSYLFILLTMGAGLFLYLNRSLEQHSTDEMLKNLRSETGLAALLIERESYDLQHDTQELATLIAKRVGARTTLIARDGRIVGDSALQPGTLLKAENHADRPEVRDALLRGEGTSIRHSSTMKTRMAYVAIRLGTEKQPGGVLRLGLPLVAVENAKKDLRASLAVALILSTLLAVGLSLILTQVSSQLIDTLCAGARRFGSGDFRTMLPVESHDELGLLAQTMNRMARQLQRQMERLASERNRLDTILRGMGEGLLVVDLQGKVQLINPAFRSLLTVKGEIVDRLLTELNKHPELHQICHEVLTTHQERTREIDLGEGRTLLTHWVPLREEYTMIGVIAVFHDISNLKRLERVRRDFVANVSHELRTPITVISGYAETLAGGVIKDNPETAERFAAIIRTHAERLTALIGDLLTLSQLESGHFKLDLVPTPLSEKVLHCCALLEPKASGKEIRLDTSAVPQLDVMADPQRLEQILVNLIDNAIKFSPSEGVVTISASQDRETVHLDIRDNGPGIPADALPRIFERFYRVDSGRSRAEGGTGLGLAIVKHLAQLHGGSVSVASTPPTGSTFTLSLPIAKRPD